MKSYPSYKDSGMEWIGMIPTDWDCFRLGMLGVFSSSGIDKKSKDDEENVRMVNYTDLIKGKNRNPVLKGDNDYMKVTTPQSKLVEHKLEKGDMVFIPSSETYEDLGYSSLIDFEEDDIVYSYHILRFKNHRPMFHYFKKYFINHHSVLNQFSLKGKGTTRQIIGRNVFRNVRVVLPPLPEQKQIVSFLDTKTQKIDELIEKTEQKIELLKEKRTSLINHCVTKGLNPNVEMKDSGVEWIGEIPFSWEIGKLNHVTNKLTNGYVGSTRGVMKESGVPYIQGIHIKKGEILYTPEGHYYVSEEWSNEHKKSILKEGDVLVVQTGTIGEVGYVTKEFEGCNCHSLIIIQLKSEFGIGKYLNYFIMSNYVKNFFRTIKTGEILEHLNTTKVKYMKICIPPISEQTQIVEYLDEQTQKIDSTIEKENQRIELLKEYRQSLISEVVTGKVDVRGWNGN